MPTPTPGFAPPNPAAPRWEQIEPVVKALLDRPVRSRDELERWLLDRSEFDAACAEAEANLYIDMTCDTEDQAKQAAYTPYIETTPPQLKPLSFALDKKLVEASA